MNKTAKIPVSVFLALVLLISCLPAFAASAKNESPVIFIAGFVSTPTVDMETGDRIFPPDSDTIKNAFMESAGDIARSVLTRNWASLDAPLTRVLHGIFDPVGCDANGDPYNAATTTAFVWPTAEEIMAKYDPVKGWTAADNIYYSFDWRLDLYTLAAQFHDFAEYVLDVTGAETLDVIGSSMGACVLSTYMAQYDYEYLNKVVFLSGAYQGASVCGDAFNGKFAFDTDTLITFLSSLTGRDVKGELLNALIDILYQQGIAQDVVELAVNINTYAMGNIYAGALSVIFGRIPGFWALIPYDLYDSAKENFVTGLVTDRFYERIDYYHEIQGRVPELIQTGIVRGVGVSILSKYGTSGIPAVESQKNLTDMVVDTKYSSIGAVCAEINAPFDASYTQAEPDGYGRISCDRYIDASACAFPDYTWFLKNLKHTQHTLSEYDMIDALFAFAGQPTVRDLPDYPQFMILTRGDELVPLTPETDYAMCVSPEKGDTFFARLGKVLADLRIVFNRLFQLLKEALHK